MQREAELQDNIPMRCLAKAALVNYYGFKVAFAASLRHVFPETHHFLHQQKSWNYYYSTWSLWANFLIFANEGSKAQNEVRNMYEDAKKRNNIYGIGLA